MKPWRLAALILAAAFVGLCAVALAVYVKRGDLAWLLTRSTDSHVPAVGRKPKPSASAPASAPQPVAPPAPRTPSAAPGAPALRPVPAEENRRREGTGILWTRSKSPLGRGS